MANKRTIINADEELVIQGKLTIEGEFVQKEFVETVSYTESKFAGDFLVVNSDGFDLTNNPTNSTVRLRYGNSNADIRYGGTTFAFSKDIETANIVSTGTITGNLVGNAASATILQNTRTFSISGDGVAPIQNFNGSQNVVLDFTLDTSVNATPGSYGSATQTPVITVNSKGLVESSAQTAIDHDQLLNFVTDEHIPHTSISISAGPGLTGGGDISQTRTLEIGQGTGIIVNTNDIAVSESYVESLFSVTDTGGDGSLSYANGVFTYTGPSATEVRAHLSATNGVEYNSSTGAFQAVEAEIQHDNLDGFLPDEHVAHSGVTLTAGAGLTGGGTIASSRTFNIGESTGITVNADSIQTNDSEIVHDDLSGFVANEHIDHSGVTLSAGAGLTGGGDITTSRTFNIGAGTGITVNADDIEVNPTFVNSTTESYISGGDGVDFASGVIDVDGTVVRTSGNQTIAGDKTFTGQIDLSGANVPGFTVTSDMIVDGDLTIRGTLDTENTVDTYVVDQKITLNANAVSPATVEIISNRPGTDDTSIRWNESTDKWQFTNDGSTYHDLLTVAATQGTLNVNNVSGFGNLSYSTGTINHVGVSQQDIRDQFSIVGGGLDYDDSAGEFSTNIATIRTYITSTIAGGDGTLVYDQATGIITYTGPGITEARNHITNSPDQIRAHFSGGTAINLTGGTISLGTVPSEINFTESKIKMLNDSIGIGASAGTFSTTEGNAIAIGNEAGASFQDRNTVAIGLKAGETSQYRDSVAIGHLAGNDEQGVSAGAGRSVAVGFQAGQVNQGGQALALGESAGLRDQGQGAVAIGTTAGAVFQGEFAVAIGPSAGKGTASPISRQANSSIVIRAGGAGYPAVTGTNEGAFYVSPIRHNATDTSNVLMYNESESEITTVASTIFVSSTANQTVSGTKTFSGELVIPDSSSTTEGAIYYDNTINDAYIYINGVAKKITPAVDAGDVEAVGAGTYDVYGGTRLDGPTTYHGIKSIDQGSYMSLSEASNVITIGADISSIRNAFSASDNGGDGSFSYDSGTGAFTYTGPSASEVRTKLGATGLLSYNSGTGVFSTSADNYNDWSFVTDSGGGAQDTVLSGELLTIQGGTNITVTNIGNVITIANDNTADITGVTAGSGLTGGGSSGAVTLNVNTGDGINIQTDAVAVDSTVVRTSDNQTIAGNKTFTGDTQIDTLSIANNYELPTADGSVNQVLATDGAGQLAFTDVTTIGGTVTGVSAGDGLTGGGIAGTVTLNVVGGTGIVANANDIALDFTEFDTSDIIENTNLYYTDARARAAVSAGGDLSYTSSTGVFSFTERTDAEVRGLISAGGDLSYNATTGVISYTDPSPRTDATIRSLFSGSGDISYDANTGQFSFTDSDRSDATIRGLFSGGTGITYNSGTGAISLTDTGYVTGVTAGTGLSGGGTSGTVSLAFDGSELTDMTAAVVGSQDELILLDNGADRRKLISEIALSQFNNDSGWTSNVGDITGVTAGTGLTGGGSSGSVTLALATAGAGAATYGSTANATKIDSITLDAYGRVTAVATGAVGDIQGVTAGTNLNGGGTSGTPTLNLDTTLTAMTAATFSGTVTANLFDGIASSAKYADLAEKYESDSNYEAGTVVVYGGNKEITTTTQANDHRVAGVISTDPAYMMNSESTGQYVALRGRVPCKVIGPVRKGDVLVTSVRPGFAQASDNPHSVSACCIVGKALQNFDGTEGVVEVVV